MANLKVATRSFQMREEELKERIHRLDRRKRTTSKPSRCMGSGNAPMSSKNTSLGFRCARRSSKSGSIGSRAWRCRNHLKTLELHRLKQCTNELKEYFTCTISQQPKPYMLSAGQIYEDACIMQWLRRRDTCPNTGMQVKAWDYVNSSCCAHLKK
jgi:hypothetical protein